jgi:anti-sigma B factor antagonist
MPTKPPVLKLDMAHVDDACVIRIEGELDIAGCPALELALQEARQSQAERILLDLQEVTFMDARGLRAILEASRRSTSNGNRVQIARGNGLLARLFRLTELDKVMPLTDYGLSPAIGGATPRNIPIDCNSAPTIEGRTLPRLAALGG